MRLWIIRLLFSALHFRFFSKISSYLGNKEQVLLGSLLFHLYGNELLFVAPDTSCYVQNANDFVIFLPYVGIY